MRDQYDDAKGQINFLLYQVQLLEYQGMMMRCAFGEYRPEPPIKRSRFRADAIRDLYDCFQRIEASLSPMTSMLASEFAAMLLQTQNKAALDLLKPIVMEGDCYWAGEADDNDPASWRLFMARGNPKDSGNLRFAQLADRQKRYIGVINEAGDILPEAERFEEFPFVWKADGGSIEGWHMDHEGLVQMERSKRRDLLERRRATSSR